MNPFSMVAIVLTITAIFAVINDRIIKLHRTIGVMLIALVMSLCIIAAKQLGFIQDDVMTELIGRFNFGETLIQGMLGALLFGDAINLRYEDMRPRLVVISVLAVVGVIISTFIVGYLVYFAASALHIHVWRGRLAHRPDCGDCHPALHRCFQRSGHGRLRRVAV